MDSGGSARIVTAPMTYPPRCAILLLAASLAFGAGGLSACRRAPPSSASAASAAQASQAAPAVAVLYRGGVPVTSLTYDSRVFFDFDQDQPRAGAGAVLDALAQRLKREPDTHAAVLGHTDAVGGDAYNMTLSRRRAETVVRELEARGVAGGRLRAIGIGKREPVAADDTEAGRARNRRVEFLISPSARAIADVIRARPTSLRENHPAAQTLRARQPTPLSRAPLGAPVTY